MDLTTSLILEKIELAYKKYLDLRLLPETAINRFAFFTIILEEMHSFPSRYPEPTKSQVIRYILTNIAETRQREESMIVNAFREVDW